MEHASAEEVVDQQKKKSARNHFFFGLSSRDKDVNPSSVDNEEPTKRNAGDSVIVSHLIYISSVWSYSKKFSISLTEKKGSFCSDTRFQNLHLRRK